jgi:hypothetical protein
MERFALVALHRRIVRESRRWRDGEMTLGHGSHVVKKSLMPMIWLCVLWLPVKPCRVVRKAA